MKIVIDPQVYSLEAVKKAAYRVLDRFAARISVDASGFICEVAFAPDMTDAQRNTALDDFWKELLDQDLRERIGQETAAIRNAVLAVAFAPVVKLRE